MKTAFTIEDLKKSKVAHLNQHVFNQPKKTSNGKIVTKHYKKRSKEKDYIGWNLSNWCNQQAVTLIEEYKFSESRNYRFDWCIPSLKLAIEYDGGIFNPNGDHRSIKGINRDVEKYNLAAAEGWILIRLTALNYTTLNQALKKYER